ncbi:MAG: peroxiredoxin-like family protein [Edaphobacter sp.]|uniref:peroxiredoxin-like family protein n=1 Tax=Edaphobacter sp. TaxID=1934404 RepID=UPI00238A30FD|nr:peroxiredoxin-like family protein [Edaphobacter sp.]MDE1175261.1 peroxiredoxin-like family protein [Edaphobacter sp.]
MAASLNNKSLHTPLQEQLDLITQNTRALVQPERLAFSERMVAELFSTGIEDRILQAGVAPSFSLQDGHHGKTVNSSDLLALGPLVISFFRGRWDPYCMTELENWRNLYSELRSRSALFVAISPQTTRQNAFTIDQHGLPFPLLTDPGCAVAEQFGLAHSVSQEHRRYFQSILVNIPYNNAGLNYQTATEESWRLPLPAVYIVRQDGSIAFAEAHADHRVRTEPADVFAALDAL